VSKGAEFIRARSADQVETRRSEILSAAADLMMQDGIGNISLNGIARRAGIAKSNLYRYFTGKEEILFELLTSDYVEWFNDVEARLKALPSNPVESDIARAISTSLKGRERLCTFISVKSVILENNMSEETTERFSTYIQSKIGKVLVQLCLSLGDIEPARGAFVLRSIYAAVAGLWPMAQHPHKKNMKPEWQCNFHDDLEAITQGILIAVHHNSQVVRDK
jgi:AcrR family transcriptional regulator